VGGCAGRWLRSRLVYGAENVTACVWFSLPGIQSRLIVAGVYRQAHPAVVSVFYYFKTLVGKWRVVNLLYPLGVQKNQYFA
jgi:hypothetical protein